MVDRGSAEKEKTLKGKCKGICQLYLGKEIWSMYCGVAQKETNGEMHSWVKNGKYRAVQILCYLDKLKISYLSLVVVLVLTESRNMLP
jgi:hypothetical protein